MHLSLWQELKTLQEMGAKYQFEVAKGENWKALARFAGVITEARLLYTILDESLAQDVKKKEDQRSHQPSR